VSDKVICNSRLTNFPPLHRYFDLGKRRGTSFVAIARMIRRVFASCSSSKGISRRCAGALPLIIVCLHAQAPLTPAPLKVSTVLEMVRVREGMKKAALTIQKELFEQVSENFPPCGSTSNYDVAHLLVALPGSLRPNGHQWEA
jgi:hypothetical protein